MQAPIFITGIGTDVGKTIVAATIVQALEADYWKPIQAGFSGGTDETTVKNLVSNSKSVFHKEVYKLSLPVSPHIAAREEAVDISINQIVRHLPNTNNRLIIEGAGGLLVPINNNQFVLDIIKALKAKVILISRNYLGSINHSLLTAAVCKQQNIDVLGWIFNDQYLNYEQEIVDWSGYPKIASIPFINTINQQHIATTAINIKAALQQYIYE